MELIKKHKWAIILAVLTAIIVSYPQIYLRYDHRDIYKGIDLMGASDDESPWMSRVREVQDGHLLMSNPYFKEGKNDPYLVQPFGSIIVAYTGKFFGLGINNTILLSRLLFVFILFLIIYAFILLTSGDKLTALAVTSSLLLGKSLIGRRGLFELLSGNSPSTTFLALTRPVNPIMTWLFFFGFLLSFWLFFERRQRLWGILSALILGLSFYDYFYTWSFLYAFCGVLMLILLIQKKWQDVKRIFFILLAGLLISIPFFINLYRCMMWPTHQEVGQRIGLVDGRMPSIGILVVLLFVIFFIFFPKQWKERYIFFLALVIAPFVVLNQQIITTKALMISHYHWYMHVPLAIIIILMTFFLRFPKRFNIFKKAVALLVIVVSIYTGVLIQQSSYAAQEERIIENQKYGPLMDWFNDNAKAEEVVFANVPTSKAVVIYTPLNVFYHPTVKYLFGGERNRLTETLFLFYRLEGIGKDDAKNVFFKDRREISASIYGIYYRETAGGFEAIPDEILEKLVEEYQNTFTLSTAEYFEHLTSKYGVNYLVWDKKYNPEWRLDNYSFLKKVAEIDDFVIYVKED